MEQLKLSITLSGQTTTIEINEGRDYELGEVMIAIELLLLGAGFQPDTIKKYLNADL